jgi:hypothetical protein
VRLTGHLGNIRVLAVEATEVTPYGSYRKGLRTRIVVKERLLLNGVNVLGNGISIDQRIEHTIHVLSYGTDPLLPFLDMTAVIAEVTVD